MKAKDYILIVLSSVVVTGIFIWFSSDHNHNNDFTIPFILSILFVIVYCIFTAFQIGKIVSATIIGVILALIIKIKNDWRFDPTSHNLFPFEIVIDLFAISIATMIGAAIGSVYRKFRKRKIFDNR